MVRPLARPAALAAAGVALLAGCSDGTGPRASTLSAKEAQAVADALIAELGSAVGGVSLVRAPARTPAATALAMGALRAARAPQPANAAATTSSFGSVTASCARGGSIKVDYTESDDLTDAGTGSFSFAITVTPQGCVVSTGTRDLTVRGDPSLVYSGGGAFVNDEPSRDFTLRTAGGIAWTGGRCAMDYTVTITPAGRATIAGSACGESVSGTYGGTYGSN